jgi:proteasome lid subunit RPN8/RPN11
MPMMPFIALQPAVRPALRVEAARAHPDECCGLLAGRAGVVELVVPVANVSSQPRSRYEIAPAELWSARRRIEAAGLEVVGYYHSHPRTEPVPSPYDIDRAYYPDAVYVIVGVEPRFEVRAFRIAGGSVVELDLAGAAGPDDERERNEEGL